jgi:hypothetical protein
MILRRTAEFGMKVKIDQRTRMGPRGKNRGAHG